MSNSRNRNDSLSSNIRPLKERILLSDITSEFAKALKKRALFAIVAFLLALTYIFTRPIVLKGDLTFSSAVDTNISEIVLNELFSSKELDQIIEKGRFQWRWSNQAERALYFHPKIQLYALKDFLAQQLSDKPHQEITTLLNPTKVLKARNQSAKTLSGTIDILEEGFRLVIDGQILLGQWNNPISDPIKGLWEIELAPPTVLSSAKHHSFILLNQKEAKERLLKELSIQVVEGDKNPKLKLEHHLKGQVDTIALLKIMEKQIQNPSFQNKLARRIQFTSNMERSTPKSHLFFDKHHNTPQKKSSHLSGSTPQGLLSLPQEVSQDETKTKNKVLTFEEKADRYFDSKVIEPHFLSTTEPVPAVQHWLLAPLFFILFFLIFVFCESLLRIFRKGVPLTFSSLSKRGFIVLSDISELFSDKNLGKVALWLTEEKKTRYQLQEVATRVLFQDTSTENLLNLKNKLEELGYGCDVFVLKNANTTKPRIESPLTSNLSLTSYSYLKVDYKKAAKQLRPRELSKLISRRDRDFILLQCPLTLDDPTAKTLKMGMHFTVASNPSLSLRELGSLDREKTLFIVTI